MKMGVVGQIPYQRDNNQMAECENGHKYNYYFNTAMNVGIFGLKKYGYLND